MKKRPFKKYFKPRSHPSKPSFLKNGPEWEKHSQWTPVMDVIREFAKIYEIRELSFDYKITETGREYLEVNFYRLKKLLSEESLEIFDNELELRILQSGFDRMNSYYFKSGFKVHIGLKRIAEPPTLPSTPVREAIPEKEVETPPSPGNQGLIANLQKKVLSMFGKKPQNTPK